VLLDRAIGVYGMRRGDCSRRAAVTEQLTSAGDGLWKSPG